MNHHQAYEKVLVVDNEHVILELLERVLSQEGYRVTTTACGEDAIGLLSTGGFDLAIVDAGLRRLNAGKLMNMMRESSPETAIVVMTGYPMEEVVRFAQEHAQGYLEKPFDLQEFLEVVRGALEEAVMYGGKSGQEILERSCET